MQGGLKSLTTLGWSNAKTQTHTLSDGDDSFLIIHSSYQLYILCACTVINSGFRGHKRFDFGRNKFLQQLNEPFLIKS